MRIPGRKTRRTFWVRADKWNPAKKQRKAAERWGAEVIYEDGVGVEDWPGMVNQLTHGDPLGMTDLSRIAPTRKQLDGYLRMALATGAVIEDMQGRRSDNAVQMAEMILEAISTLAQDAKRRTPEQASKAGYARWDKVSRAAAEAAWRDLKNFRLIDDVVQATGWSRKAMHEAFGARGTGLGGRPRKGNRK